MEHANTIITVRYAGATNTKGSRWIVNAKDDDRRAHIRRTISRDHGTNSSDDAHAAAQTALDALRVEVEKLAQRARPRHRVEATATLVVRYATHGDYTFLGRVELTWNPWEVTL